MSPRCTAIGNDTIINYCGDLKLIRIVKHLGDCSLIGCCFPTHPLIHPCTYT